jgi:choline transport protein
VLSIAGFTAIFITCLIRSKEKQSSEFVWKTFMNSSGWSSDGIVFLTGLTNPNYIYAGIDGAIHLAEECKDAAITVPRALMSTVFIGFVTSFAFVIAMTYSFNDFDAVLTTRTGYVKQESTSLSHELTCFS